MEKCVCGGYWYYWPPVDWEAAINVDIVNLLRHKMFIQNLSFEF